MKPIVRPGISAELAYRACSSEAEEPTRTVLENLTNRAVQASSEFVTAALGGDINQLAPANFVVAPHVDPHLRENYSRRMVKRRNARAIYDEIRLSSVFCALCGVRQTATLDHYLPKSRFPLLAVAPDNLLPACPQCNQSKAEYYPDRSTSALIHPYFDQFLEDHWLAATVIERSRSVTFSVAPPPAWLPVQVDRLRGHFDRLSLGSLYSMMAATEISSMRQFIADMNEQSRQAFLNAMADSVESGLGVNHWRTATLRALATSDWYVSEGHVLMC